MKNIIKIILFTVVCCFSLLTSAEDLKLDKSDATKEGEVRQESSATARTEVEEDGEDLIEDQTEVEAEEEDEEEVLVEVEQQPVVIKKGKTRSKSRKLIGWVEEVSLSSEELLLDAKITPGTLGNSLHSDKITANKKSKTIDFIIADKTGREVQLTRKYSSQRKNKYTVKLDFCLAGRHFEVDFEVSDRSSFDHPVRIGRDTIAGLFVVDPASIKLTEPNC